MPQSFRTEIKLSPSKIKLNYHSRILFTGSCFTENIGLKMQDLKFNTLVNPFGILYNPLSINNMLQMLLAEKQFSKKDIHHFNEQWLSFAHHGKFSHPDPTIFLKKLNTSTQAASGFLKKADVLIITLGTAFVYFLKETGQVAANCHKMPQKHFNRKRLSVAEITTALQPTIEALLVQNPNLHILFTVSPIRHWKDGAIDNQLSKATLIVAIHELVSKFEPLSYFPAYELLMDDLRDYRFYEADMLHPNDTAINYIWEQFLGVYMEASAKEKMKTVAKILAAVQHRPRNSKSEAHQRFIRQQLLHIKQVSTQFPFISFSTESAYFEQQLTT